MIKEKLLKLCLAPLRLLPIKKIGLFLYAIEGELFVATPNIWRSTYMKL